MRELLHSIIAKKLKLGENILVSNALDKEIIEDNIIKMIKKEIADFIIKTKFNKTT